MLPELFPRPKSFTGRLEQLTTELQDLVDQKSQHHEQNKDLGQVFIAKTEIMIEVIASVFQ